MPVLQHFNYPIISSNMIEKEWESYLKNNHEKNN